MIRVFFNFIRNIFLIVKYLFIWIRLFLINSRLRIVENKWYLTKNHNFFNPTFAATIFRYGPNWRIDRYNNFYGNFENHSRCQSVHISTMA